MMFKKILIANRGEIVNVYVETGHPVQYGERLFAIRTTGAA